MTHFTARELEVLDLLVDGYSNKDIARELVISIHTTKAHVSSIYKKYGVTNRVQAVSKTLEQKMKTCLSG